MNSHLAIGIGPSFQELHRIARLKGLSLIESDNKITLGPAKDSDLLSCVLLWNHLRPDLAESASFTIHPAVLQRQLAPIGRVSWSDVSLTSELVKRLEIAENGEEEWKELDAYRLTKPPIEKPPLYFGRSQHEKIVQDRIAKNIVIILDAQRYMGRTTFAKGYAHNHGSQWVDGVDYIDFSSETKDEKAKEILSHSPWEIALKWRAQHQLIILDHVDADAEWLTETMSIIARQGSLASFLILASKGNWSGNGAKIILPQLDFESFFELWASTFGHTDPDHLGSMASFTGRLPGVVDQIKSQVGNQSVEALNKIIQRGLKNFPTILDELGVRLDELEPGPLSMLRHLSRYTSQISLNLAMQGAETDAKALAKIAALIDKGWLFVEEDGYRVPHPMAMAVRRKYPNSREDWVSSVKALTIEAERLSKKGVDLAPTKNLSAFKRLLWTGYDPLYWLSQQNDEIDLTLDAVGLFWVPALTEGHSEEFLTLTDKLYYQLDHIPISHKTVLYWEARGRHMRTKGDLPASLEAHTRGFKEAKELGDQRGALWNLHFKAACLSLMGQRQEADAAYEELIPDWRKFGIQKDIAYGLCTLCLHFFRYRQMDLMPDLLVEAFSVARKSDEVGLLSSVKELQGWLAHTEGHFERSIELMDEADLLANQVKHARRDLIGLGRGLAYWMMGDREGAIESLYGLLERPFPIEALSRYSLELHLSQLELMHGTLEPALTRIKSLNQQMIDYQARVWMGDILDLNALAAWRLGHYSSAAILAGCGFHWHSLSNRGGLAIEKEVRFWIPDCREKLGESQFQARFQTGGKLDPDKLLALTRVDYALVSQTLPDFFEPESTEKPLLSSRQKDVVRLAGEGLSNKRIAEALFLEEGTVKRHLHNAAQELGVKGRVALVRKATDLGLIP